MKRIAAFLAAAAVLAGVAATAGSTPPARAVPLPSATALLFDDPEMECLEFQPAALNVPVVDPQDPITVGVHVLADRGVSEARARSIVEAAQAAYTPLNIDLEVVSSQKVDLTGTDALDLVQQTKDVVGGSRPAGSDVVATVTSADLTINLDEENSTNGVAGIADCIGGIRYADRSFFVAEDPAITIDYPDEGYNTGVTRIGRNLAAKVFGHELGHILGAHHHYGNCVEGLVVATEGEYAPCTLMLTVAVEFMANRFGAFESSVIRGHANEWARP